jgi:glutamate--cysteine ligase
MSLDTRPETHQPLRDPAELLAPFRFKPEAEQRVGLEHENVGYCGQAPVPYADSRGFGIGELLRRFGRFGFEPFLEHDHPIAMLGPALLQISLEPGGQVELAGNPDASVHAIADEQARHLARLRAIGAEMGFTFTSIGYRPVGTVANGEWMPKERYQVMRKFLVERGQLGLDMMLMTGTAQVSVDYQSEADLADKLATAASVSAVVSALCANSPLVDGKPSGYLSYRCRVWQDVDSARTGLPKFLLEDFSLQRYIDWALEAPMIFIRRQGEYLPMRGYSFRRFLQEGLDGERASAVDWADHLSTLFPDVRVKSVIELRTADAAGADMAVALVAFWKGVLYDALARREARELTMELNHAERLRLRDEVARRALGVRLGRASVREVARDLVQIARRGLVRQGCAHEIDFLAPLEEIAATGLTRAERLLRTFERGGIAAVIEATAI